MIRIGLSEQEKQKLVNKYCQEYGIKKGFVLYFKKFKPDFSVPCEIEYIEYSDIIMYKFFYRLLEEIDDDCLVVVNECLRTQNRSELTYNCAHHYLNQTKHRVIFEYFPFIEDEQDLMILLDFLNKSKYYGKSFSEDFLAEENIKVKPIPFYFAAEKIAINDKQAEEYERKKEALFANLGKKDPDTVPRNLHLFVGKYKKPHIRPDQQYIARNGRYNKPNVATYQKYNFSNPKTLVTTEEGIDCIILDFAHRRLDFNDYLKISGHRKLKFLSTGLPVDEYYNEEFINWWQRVSDFHAKASLYQ